MNSVKYNGNADVHRRAVARDLHRSFIASAERHNSCDCDSDRDHYGAGKLCTEILDSSSGGGNAAAADIYA